MIRNLAELVSKLSERYTLYCSKHISSPRTLPMFSNKPSFFNALSTASVSSEHDLSQGLLAPRAHCSPKYFYNALGSTLFDAITHLPEYYLTRTEAAIFSEHADSIHAQIPSQAAWLDLGAGSCEKAARLFEQTPPGLYVAVDISLDYLTGT